MIIQTKAPEQYTTCTIRGHNKTNINEIFFHSTIQHDFKKEYGSI